MARPSRNIDKLLIETGTEMLRESGLAQLSVRDLAAKAGVNLGMFHYHFKNKETFARLVLQELYETVFARLVLSLEANKSDSDHSVPAVVQLRQVLGILAMFARDQRNVIFNIATDITLGAPTVRDFAKQNFPRHIAIVMKLIEKAQQEGDIVKLPMPQILGFMVAAIVSPLIGASLVSRFGGDDLNFLSALMAEYILPDQAIYQRIDMALKGVSPSV
jgi:AcrR family transcriptional regulator